MNLKITFTGICAFVINSDAGGRCKAIALLPDGDGNKPTVGPALDGADLRRHRAYIKFQAKNLKSAQGLSENLEILRYLGAERITIRPISDTALTSFVHNLESIADLDKIVPGYSEVDPVLLVSQPPPRRLAAQVLFEHGTLEGTAPPLEWVFPNTLSKQDFYARGLSHETELNIPTLTSADLIIKKFDSSSMETLTFTGGPTDLVEIMIANLCDTNPLRWETVTDPVPPDEDFRWYYQLVKDRSGLTSQLRELDLPIPYPAGKPNGQGMNCLGARPKPALINLDSQLP